MLSALVGVLIAPKEYIHPNMMVNMQLYGFTAGVLADFRIYLVQFLVDWFWEY